MTCHMSFTALTDRPFVSPQALVLWWPCLDPAFGFVPSTFLFWHLSLLHPAILAIHPVIPSSERSIHRNHFLATVTSIKDLTVDAKPHHYPSLNIGLALIRPERSQH